MLGLWDHFAKKNGKAVCKVQLDNGTVCGAQMECGNNTSSLHLVNKYGMAKGAPAKKTRTLFPSSGPNVLFLFLDVDIFLS